MDLLKELLTASLQSSGAFQPFKYAIGLEDDLPSFLKGQRFPLEEPYTASALADFGKALTSIHEFTHFAQYVSCGIGLRNLRYTFATMTRLVNRHPSFPPLIQTIKNTIGLSTQDHLDLECCVFS